jgi:hypothetical protein
MDVRAMQKPVKDRSERSVVMPTLTKPPAIQTDWT